VNGAAGIVPVVLHYDVRFVPGTDDDDVVRRPLSAATVGLLSGDPRGDLAVPVIEC
jgi:L-serine dehydratase